MMVAMLSYGPLPVRDFSELSPWRDMFKEYLTTGICLKTHETYFE